MSLALLTRGYICRGRGLTDVELGEGPDIVRAQPLRPRIDHGRQIDGEPLAPEIIHGEEEEEPCP